MRRPLIKLFLYTLAACALASLALAFAPLEPAGTGARLGLALIWLAGLFWIGFRLHRHLIGRIAGN
jgi:hypothetical protein